MSVITRGERLRGRWPEENARFTILIHGLA